MKTANYEKSAQWPEITRSMWLVLIVLAGLSLWVHGWRGALAPLGLALQLSVYSSLRTKNTLEWPWPKKLLAVFLAFGGLAVMVAGFWLGG